MTWRPKHGRERASHPPSARFTRAAYRQFPDAGFVIHTHQTYASALGLAGFDQGSISTADRAALGGIALAKYGLHQHEAPAPQRDRRARHRRTCGTDGTAWRIDCGSRPCGNAGTLQTTGGGLQGSVPGQRMYGLRRRGAGASSAERCTDRLPPCRGRYRARRAGNREQRTLLRAQLDDMAQMIGCRMRSVKPAKGAVVEGRLPSATQCSCAAWVPCAARIPKGTARRCKFLLRRPVWAICTLARWAFAATAVAARYAVDAAGVPYQVFQKGREVTWQVEDIRSFGVRSSLRCFP